jgi:chromatin remodeling complex protein RSC6
MQKTTRKGKNTKNNVEDVDVVIEDSVEDQTITTKKTAKESTTKKSTTPKETTKKSTKEIPKEEIPKEEMVATPTETSPREPKPDVTALPLCQANIINSMDDIIASIEVEIQNIREGVTTKGGIKFLRSVNKNVKTLRTKAIRVMKQKPVKIKRANERNNTNSGFLKPVSISKEMCNFTGWGADELHSRVDVTKFVCNYIKENNLQNPDDRRQITPDAKLKKLLNYNSKNGEPLKYYTLQTYLKQHFTK